MADEVVERIVVAAPPGAVFDAVADVRRMARLSPECFATWVLSRSPGRLPGRFVGFNRRGPYVWFTTCRVVAAEPGAEFAFDVTTFGLPVARWGFRLAPADGGTQVSQYWIDQRVRGAMILGRVFTGKVANARPAANREGMRITLDRLKRQLESPRDA
ncbi:SRPBCC family protein [Dactylosporangium siamense]|uniref:Polyketide cyclase n=1 Tax=Dactylosporangium siamense TaxID=685454 RepID=A0A919UH15_9ACTN|nr:SRPBCC family protein [Dactylosporangium siamense]GIG51941.1 polyketide cyclase [Dactylosporangium siamense]